MAATFTTLCTNDIDTYERISEGLRHIAQRRLTLCKGFRDMLDEMSHTELVSGVMTNLGVSDHAT